MTGFERGAGVIFGEVAPERGGHLLRVMERLPQAAQR
jgi:hypothetical protein